MQNRIIPKKLKSGCKVAVIAPSSSLSIISKEVRDIAMERLDALGLRVDFSQHSEELDELNSSQIQSRVDDFNEAFLNKDISAIFTAIGGYGANQLLKHIDYNAIRNNPKILCGFSDITVLQNAIFAKTGLVTYSGPHFSSFGMKKGIDYTMDYFKKCLFSSEPFEVRPSPTWSDDLWFEDQEHRKFIRNSGYRIINDGKAEGPILGGNLGVFNLLRGTEFIPNLRKSVLFLEDEESSQPRIFNRDLQALIQLPEFKLVSAIVVGRFQKASNMHGKLLSKILSAHEELKHIPIISNADFGHTTPLITYPIGGKAKLSTEKGRVRLVITEH